jgi:hypothetical protein
VILPSEVRRAMKRIFDIILRTLAVCSLVGIPMGFILSGSTLTRALDSVLHIKVDPRFSGGQELARFYDPAGDDHGEGGLAYPKGKRFSEKGAFDLIKYVIFKPVTDAAWSSERAYWQLGVTLAAFPNPDAAPNGFSLPSIRIYVDTDGPASGSMETAAARAELVGFDASAPWDMCITVDGWHGQALLRTSDGKIQRRIPLIAVPQQKSVYVRLPLDIPQVRRILDGRPTRHYVMICGYDPLAVDAVMQVAASPSQDKGEGARSSLTPRVFDILALGSGKQEKMLGSYDEASFRYAALVPVTAGGASAGAGAGAGDAARPAVDLEALEAAADREARGSGAGADTGTGAGAGAGAGAGTNTGTGAGAGASASSSLAAQASSADPLVSGAALFQLGKGAEAEAKFRGVLAVDPANATALAYLGSITAQKGGAAGSPADSVRLVGEAFDLLDKAAAAAKTDDEREIALLNRASVASAVPEDVFGKSIVAARDFMSLAKISQDRGDARTAGDRLVSAGLAFEKAAAAGDADIAFATALSQRELSARARLELARRGYPIPAAGE